MGKHGGRVVLLSAWRNRSLRGVGQFGPVVGPIGRAQISAANAGHLLDGHAAIRGDATSAPIGDGLDGLAERIGQALQGEGGDCGLKGGSGCHACSLHGSCSLSTRIVSTYAETSGMADTVWYRIDRELQRRLGLHLKPGSWAALGAMINQTSQTTTNWKTRGVPPKRYAEIAQALGWTMEQLLTGDKPEGGPSDPLEEPYKKVYLMLSEDQRRAVYAHALQLALNLSPEDAQRAAERASGLAGTDTPRQRGQHQGGMSNFGDLDEGEQKAAKGGRK